MYRLAMKCYLDTIDRFQLQPLMMGSEGGGSLAEHAGDEGVAVRRSYEFV
jgi:hypothetical protein